MKLIPHKRPHKSLSREYIVGENFIFLFPSNEADRLM